MTIAGITKEGEEEFNFASSKDISKEIRAVTPESMQAAVMELDRIKNTKHDYVVPGTKLHFNAMDGVVRMDFPIPQAWGGPTLPVIYDINNTAHGHLSQKLGINGHYYTRMRKEYPELLAYNLNAWAERETGNFMVRELDGHARAVLSDTYKGVDGADFFIEAAQRAVGLGAVISKIEVNEEQMAFRAVLPEFGAKIIERGNSIRNTGKLFSSGYKKDNGTWQGPDNDDPDGEWIFPAIVGFNNDVGKGRFGCYVSALAVGCSNYIMAGIQIARVHRGARQDMGLIDYSEETRAAQDKAMWLEIGDMVNGAFDPEKWAKVVRRLISLQETKLDNPVEAVDAVARHYSLSDEDRQNVLNELIAPKTRALDPGRTAYGLLQAVTSLQHVRPIEGSMAIEAVGGDLIDNFEKILVAQKHK